VLTLKEERKVQKIIANTNIEQKVANLRTRTLRRFLEGYQAAVFAYLIGSLINKEIQFALEESADYDAVFRWVVDDVVNYAPIQLKELVPPAQTRIRLLMNCLIHLRASTWILVN
jgi:hypothetical protein